VSQSRAGSLAESVCNIAVGFGLNFVVNLALLPALGFDVHVHDAAIIGVIFTFVSLARSYCIRRWFNGKTTGCLGR
jgi:hypothetical protein